MGLTSTLGAEGESDPDRGRNERLLPIGGGAGGAAGAVLAGSLGVSTAQGALLAGASAAVGVIVVWLLVTVFR